MDKKRLNLWRGVRFFSMAVGQQKHQKALCWQEKTTKMQTKLVDQGQVF